jgi:multiple sugar transport system substrate-binding protein
MMGATRRRIAATVGAVAAATLVLSGCSTGGAAGSGGSELELSKDPVTLTVTWWGSDARAELTNAAIDAFEEEYPNITVEGQYKDWAGYWDALATSTAAGDSADVLQMDEIYLASYADRGALYDVNQAGDLLDLSAFDDASLAAGQLDGAQYAVPVGVGVYAIVVNADLFEQYGVELPDDESWTWDDLAATAQELTDKSGGAIHGAGNLGGFDAGSVKYWARSAGGDLFNEDGEVALEPEALADLWEFNLELIESGAAESASSMVEGFAAGLSAGSLATNKVAIGTAYNTQITALRAASGQDLRLMKLPRDGAQNKPDYYKPSMYWAVSAQSEHPAEAAVFVDFMLNSDAAAEILKTERGIPANTEVRESLEAELSPDDQLAVDYLNAIDPGEPSPLTPNGGSSIEAIFQRYTQEVYFGQLSPEEAAEAAIDEIRGEVDAAA